jgi:hypothetical protein
MVGCTVVQLADSLLIQAQRGLPLQFFKIYIKKRLATLALLGWGDTYLCKEC